MLIDRSNGNWRGDNNRWGNILPLPLSFISCRIDCNAFDHFWFFYDGGIQASFPPLASYCLSELSTSLLQKLKVCYDNNNNNNNNINKNNGFISSRIVAITQMMMVIVVIDVVVVGASSYTYCFIAPCYSAIDERSRSNCLRAAVNVFVIKTLVLFNK